MPTLHDVTNGGPADASDVQQFVDTWLGRSGKGVPLEQISVSDTAKYAVDVRNLDPGNGLGLRVRGPGDVPVLLATKTGFTYSSDGANSGLVPVSQSLAETISGAKTFSALTTLTGGATLGSRLLLKRATSTASSSSLTLPTDGNIVPITGTTTITSIGTTGLTGLEVTLEFQSPNCRVQKGSTLRLNGDFFSGSAGATLTIYCDGTNWTEKSRSKARALIGSLYLSGTQGISNNTHVAVSWTAADANGNPGNLFWTAGSHVLAPYTGWYDLTGTLEFDTDADGYRIASWAVNGIATKHELGAIHANTASASVTVPMSDRLYLTAGDYIEIYAKHTAGATLNLISGDDATRVSIGYRGE